MSEASEMRVLDCTLRDGGFYTDWDFSDRFVEAYLSAMDGAGVDVVELGYRSLRRDGFFGAYRCCDEDLIERWSTRCRAVLGVMVDAKELLRQERRIDELFAPADRSRIGLVRVATTAANLESAVKQVERLVGLGYRCGLNLMAWATLPRARHQEVLRAMVQSKAELIYVADSYGSMHPRDIREVAALYEAVVGDTAGKALGIHLHNNLELAFANALEALDRGARWIDTSVLGMGRGPGNLKTELFLQHAVTHMGLSRYRTEPIYDLIGRHVAGMHQAHGWGPSAPYVLSGNLSVHPTFAQRLLGTGRYTTAEVTAVLEQLHEEGRGGAFNEAALDEAISSRHRRLSGSGGEELRALPPQSWADREVLVIGRGPSAEKHARALNDYIRKLSPIVIECNHLPFIQAGRDHYCAFVLLENARALAPVALERGKTVLVGSAGRRAELGGAVEVGAERLFWQPYEVRKATFSAGGRCVIPHDVVSMLAVAVAVQHGATRITVGGFDGYPNTANERDLRMQAEMVDFFRLLTEVAPTLRVVSLLPTGYPVPVQSIYGALFHDAPKVSEWHG